MWRDSMSLFLPMGVYEPNVVGQSLSALDIVTLVLRVVSPILVAVAAFSLIGTTPPNPASSSPSPIASVVVVNTIPRRAAILALLSLAALTYLLDGITFVVYTVLNKFWQRHTGIELNAVLGLAAFAGLAAFGAVKDVQGVQVWLLRRVRSGVFASLALDIALVVILGVTARKEATGGTGGPENPNPTIIKITDFLHLVFPAFRVLMLVPLYGSLAYPRKVYTSVADQISDDEDDAAITDSSRLLPPGSAFPTNGDRSSFSSDASKYGTFRQARSTLHASTPGTRVHSPVPSGPETKPSGKSEISLEPSWSELAHRFRRITPFLWPSKSRHLQLVALVCVVILLIARVVNVLLPMTLGKLVSVLDGVTSQSPWPFLFGYVALRFLQGSGGLSALRDALWTSVMQYSDREMSQMAFDHILNLSFAWHTRRKTGEVLRVLDRGAAINRTLELILFSIVPIFIDIIVALVVFALYFDWTISLVVFTVTVAYLTASVILTRWRSRIRRQMNERDIITRGIHTDCLLNYETVKYFGGEEHEGERYRSAIGDYQALEYRVIISLNVLNLVQNLITTLGLLVGSLIVAFRVAQGHSNLSDFVFFITYITQLYVPLNQLGSTYRSINQSLVDTEKLLHLLNEPTEVVDSPDAKPLVVDGGEIEFDNVSFSYDPRNTALTGISFKVPKGSSVALVGDSGAGKSTILRLLYRFYDLEEGNGRILIDGQNIKDVTQKSLRQSIGVVPQDSVLFNTTVRYNIAYGKFDSSDEEIENAARSAQMHDRIMSFPDGYDTKVGERGVRLSGGEKQRVSIARTLLKNPPVLLLDEATSALDTSTEKDIQKALQNLMNGRSSLSIAHRLSTIATADLILVLKDGQIVEQGSHRELLAMDGIFASMWADQISGSDDGQSAHDKKEKQLSLHSSTKGDLLEESSIIDSPSSSKPQEPPVAFPTSHSTPGTPMYPPPTVASPEPVSFPASPITDTPPRQSVEQPESSQPTGVTFDESAVPSPISASPDPNAEPKRKRISSQNFQRLGKRLSIGRRDSSSTSSIFPNLGRKDKGKETPRGSIDDGSIRGTSSPNPSILGEGKPKKDKKDKKKKKRTDSEGGEAA